MLQVPQQLLSTSTRGSTMLDNFQFKAIGYIKSKRKYTSESNRQAVLDNSNEDAYIELLSQQNFEQALQNLDEFNYIWLIFVFHQNYNQNYKPMIQPPRGSTKKVGVFATRAPHRPNPIGISAVKIKKIDGLKIYIEGHDLIDNTPILDIKPYLKYSDSFTSATDGWLKFETFNIEYSNVATQKIEWFNQNEIPISEFIKVQLGSDPTNQKTKRIQQIDDFFVISYRTWRIKYYLLNKDSSSNNQLFVVDIYSGYTEDDLRNPDDPYLDKKIHLNFKSTFE